MVAPPLTLVFSLALLVLPSMGWVPRPTPPKPTRPDTTTTEPLPTTPAPTIVEQSSNITIRVGKDTAIHCRTESEVTSCVWLWEFPQRDRTPTVVAGFPGHGQGSVDCSINLVNVSLIQTGWWTCRAQTVNTNILHSKPVYLEVFAGPVITFEVKPVNRTFSMGGPTELECKTTIPVKTCQWSFQQQGQTEPLVVTEGPPKDGRDCSFKLEHMGFEQVGAWKCGARTDDSDAFTYTDTVQIQVEHKEEAFPVEFTEEPVDTEMGFGENGRLHCKVHQDAHIEDCRWYWTPIGHSKAWTVLMREFLPVNNDCSIEFTNVTADPEGLWTCHVKPIHSKKFKSSKSAKLTVGGDVNVSMLSRHLSVYEGEPLTILCVAEQPAKSCQWRRKALFDIDSTEANSWTVIDTFQSTGNETRDCSLRVNHARMDHQGLWVCSIKIKDDSPFRDAMPTAVTVNAPHTVQFVEHSRTQLAAENQTVTLNCSTLSAVHECVWMWYEDESKVAERVIKFNFKTYKDHDCSIVIPNVERGLQGIWQCAVKYGNVSRPDTSYARPFSLTVVKTGPILFRAVSPSVHVVSGSSSLLECVVKEPVEECQWLYQRNQTSEVKEFARFEPANFNDCSLRVREDTLEGWWTCGARNPGETNFTLSIPSKLDFIQPGNMTTRSMITSNDMLVLTCLLSYPESAVNCDWIHPSGYNIQEFNDTGKYTVENNKDIGACSLSLRPMLVDVGQWKCIFSINKDQVLHEASFMVLTSPHNVRLSWIVGILATVTLMLTVLLFVVITCRFYQCRRTIKAKVKLNRPLPENNKRYSEDPTKGINFSFSENPGLLADFTAPSPLQDNHHYERVGRNLSQRPGFYQNVDQRH